MAIATSNGSRATSKTTKQTRRGASVRPQSSRIASSSSASSADSATTPTVRPRQPAADAAAAGAPATSQAVNPQRPALVTGKYRACSAQGRARRLKAAAIGAPRRGDVAPQRELAAIERGGQGVEVAAVLFDVVLEQLLQEGRHPKAKHHGVTNLVAVAILGKQPANVIGGAILQNHLAVDHHSGTAARALVRPVDTGNRVLGSLAGGVARNKANHAGEIGFAVG